MIVKVEGKGFYFVKQRLSFDFHPKFHKPRVVNYVYVFFFTVLIVFFSILFFFLIKNKNSFAITKNVQDLHQITYKQCNITSMNKICFQ